MQKITILQENDANQRLDKFLKKFLPNLALGAMYKMLRTGKIKVSGQKKEQNYRLIVGDEIQIFLSESEILELQNTKNSQEQSENSPKKIPRLDIVYQDEDLLVINKNAGMNVHP